MFVKVQHALMHKGLSSNALKVYLYLSLCSNKESIAVVRGSRIAIACHITEDTAFAAIHRLEAAGLVQKENRFLQGQYIANAYTITRLPGKWFALNLDAKPFSLPAAAFGVLLCLKRFANRNGRAFPSYTQMAAMLGGRARATISAGIALLEKWGFITRLSFRAGKHNLYALVGNKKESTGSRLHSLNIPCKPVHSKKSDCIFKLSDFGSFVKRFVKNVQTALSFSFLRGVVQFFGNNTHIHPHDTKGSNIALKEKIERDKTRVNNTS
ncbi:MAG: helix-turn-helix domain-containing protein [Oscillospiraceae bacterium]